MWQKPKRWQQGAVTAAQAVVPRGAMGRAVPGVCAPVSDHAKSIATIHVQAHAARRAKVHAKDHAAIQATINSMFNKISIT